MDCSTPGSPVLTNPRSFLKFMSIKSMMLSNHLILCHPLLLWPSSFPSLRVFSNESALHVRWPKYWSFSFNISPSNEERVSEQIQTGEEPHSRRAAHADVWGLTGLPPHPQHGPYSSRGPIDLCSPAQDSEPRRGLLLALEAVPSSVGQPAEPCRRLERWALAKPW